MSEHNRDEIFQRFLEMPLAGSAEPQPAVEPEDEVGSALFENLQITRDIDFAGTP